MKILKIFGAVVGIHLVAFVLIFANPGCTSSSKPAASAPRPDSTGSAPVITVPSTSPAPDPAAPMLSAGTTASADPAIPFDPNAGAISSPRYSPTRPNSAAAGALQASAVTNVTPASTYTVVNGDSLSSIAKKNQLTIKELSAANNLGSSTKLKLGQKLLIPGKAKPAPMASTSRPANGSGNANGKQADFTSTLPPAEMAAKPPVDSVTHVVRSGDTLGSIARKYQVKQGEIAVANNITNPAMIRACMTLVIPGWQAPRSSRVVEPSAPAQLPVAAPANGLPAESDPAQRQPAAPEVPVIKIDGSDQR